ncbi:unnamed protein product [Blepharisma stoltei]|uniref:Uncharacterized protein n=1 Tax=Blepharisma stoltei TaxID=1481888 RepID=A0AAU9J6A8_9CILI|nr:unnamed protein product [Blepharisma stoltei]
MISVKTLWKSPIFVQKFFLQKSNSVNAFSFFSRDTNIQEYKKWFSLSYDFTNSEEYKQASEILIKKTWKQGLASLKY